MSRRVRLWLDSDSYEEAREPMPFDVEELPSVIDTGILDAEGTPIVRVRQIGFKLP